MQWLGLEEDLVPRSRQQVLVAGVGVVAECSRTGLWFNMRLVELAGPEMPVEVLILDWPGLQFLDRSLFRPGTQSGVLPGAAAEMPGLVAMQGVAELERLTRPQ